MAWRKRREWGCGCDAPDAESEEEQRHGDARDGVQREIRPPGRRACNLGVADVNGDDEAGAEEREVRELVAGGRSHSACEVGGVSVRGYYSK